MHVLDELRFQAVRRLHPSAPGLSDLSGVVRTAMASLGPALDKLRPGSRIAVTCGSRGIDRLPEVLKLICTVIKDYRCDPFIVPAMGSHAGATAEGQRELLAELGVTEAQMGVPIISSMETVHLGHTPEGLDVYIDRVAWEAAHILLLNRVKMHTDFDGVVESGLLKILAVGLGKVEGATSFHRHSLRIGYEAAILSMGHLLLGTGRILGGIGLVENDRHTLSRIEGAPAAQLEKMERELLIYSRRLHGRLPFSGLDLLIVDEIGKNISGAGMDTKVIGRAVHPDQPFTRPAINIRRIYVRDLSRDSGGNANGVGFADVIHQKIAAKVDLQVTYTNAATALAYRAARMPMYLPCDRVALEFLLNNLGVVESSSLRAVWIRNTLALDFLLATPVAAAELRDNSDYEISDLKVAPAFDAQGDLLPPMQAARGVQ